MSATGGMSADMAARLAAAEEERDRAIAERDAEKWDRRTWHASRKRVEPVFDVFCNEVMPIAHVEDHRRNPEVVLPYLEAWFARLKETEEKLLAAEARAEQAERERDLAEASFKDIREKAAGARNALAAAEVRVAELEGALREIATHPCDWQAWGRGERTGEPPEPCSHCTARRALAPKEERG